MIKRIIAMTAALVFIFAVGANQKREAWGEPVAVVNSPTTHTELANESSKTEIENSKTKVYEPIRPKEVTNEGTDESRKTYDSGDAGRSRSGDEGNAIEDGAGGGGCNRDGTILAVIGATEGDPVVTEGIPSDYEGYSDGTEGAEPDAEVDYSGDEGTQPDPEADGWADEVEPTPEPEPEPEPEPVAEETYEPAMEYLGDFTISGYCSCSSCCGQWSGGPCADGSYPEEGYTCAMGGLDFGTVLYIDGVGERTVCDRGTPYGWVDLYFENHLSACEWGMQTRAVYIVR